MQEAVQALQTVAPGYLPLKACQLLHLVLCCLFVRDGLHVSGENGKVMSELL